MGACRRPPFAKAMGDLGGQPSFLLRSGWLASRSTAGATLS